MQRTRRALAGGRLWGPTRRRVLLALVAAVALLHLSSVYVLRLDGSVSFPGLALKGREVFRGEHAEPRYDASVLVERDALRVVDTYLAELARGADQSASPPVTDSAGLSSPVVCHVGQPAPYMRAVWMALATRMPGLHVLRLSGLDAVPGVPACMSIRNLNAGAVEIECGNASARTRVEAANPRPCDLVHVSIGPHPHAHAESESGLDADLDLVHVARIAGEVAACRGAVLLDVAACGPSCKDRALETLPPRVPYDFAGRAFQWESHCLEHMLTMAAPYCVGRYDCAADTNSVFFPNVRVVDGAFLRQGAALPLEAPVTDPPEKLAGEEPDPARLRVTVDICQEKGVVVIQRARQSLFVVHPPRLVRPADKSTFRAFPMGVLGPAWEMDKDLLFDRIQEMFLVAIPRAYIGKDGYPYDSTRLFRMVWGRDFKLPPRKAVPGGQLVRLGRVLSLVQVFSAEIYHQMLETIPRLLFALDLLTADPSIVILQQKLNAQFLETLDVLRINRTRVVVYDPSKLYYADVVYMSHYWPKPLIALASPEAMLAVRRLFLRQEVPWSQRKTVLVISRGKQSRRVENHAELMGAIRSALPALDIVEFTGERMTVREMALIFHTAAVVVGPHGAAFSNLLFCAEGTAVIELMQTAQPWNMYHMMAQALKLDYEVLGVKATHWSGMTVDVNQVVGLVVAAVLRVAHSLWAASSPNPP